LDFLNTFIKQAQTTDLKTKGIYPAEMYDFRMKVSFGMGTPSKRPWISILGPGMSTSNGYYPVYLYYKQDNRLDLVYGRSENVEYPDPWPTDAVNKAEENWSVFRSYQPIINNDKVTYMTAQGEINQEQLSLDLDTIVKEYKKCLDIEVAVDNSNVSQGLFHMERLLEDFIIENWDETEFGAKYSLIEEEGELKSQQYRTSIGPIDILAKDKSTGDYVVIELKRNQTSDDTVGQIARYMGWVKEHLNNDSVKGIIVCGKYDEKLNYAQEMLPNLEVFLYEVNFQLKEYTR